MGVGHTRVGQALLVARSSSVELRGVTERLFTVATLPQTMRYGGPQMRQIFRPSLPLTWVGVVAARCAHVSDNLSLLLAVTRQVEVTHRGAGQRKGERDAQEEAPWPHGQ